MAEWSIRFGITDGEGHCASTWKLWTDKGMGKSDVYLTCRALGGKLKTSLHDSGSWHIAYTPNTFKEKVEGAVAKQRDRFIEKWPRPKPIAKGVTLAYRIVTPWSSVTSSIGETKRDTSLVGSLQLENGETAWVVHRVIDMPDLSSATKGNAQFYKGMGPQDLECGNLRALVFGHEQDRSRVIYDCVVQKEPN